jgi:hypothetical protein
MASLTPRSETLRDRPEEERPLCECFCTWLIVSLDPPTWRCEFCLRYRTAKLTQRALDFG